MISSSNVTSSSSTYVQITPTSITVNIIQHGTSMITRGYDQNLTFDPGTFSIDPDGNTFNATVS